MHGSRHPIGCQLSAGAFRHADRHANAAQAVRGADNDGCDDLRVRMGVAAHLVSTAVDLAAQRRARHEGIFEAKTEAFLGKVLSRRQLQLRFFDPECPTQRCLHAQRAPRGVAPLTNAPTISFGISRDV